MNDVSEIKSFLVKIQRTYAQQRKEYMAQLQDIIWDETLERDEALQDILLQLANDLNFYEDDPRDRDESLGYYGDERLSEIITLVLGKI